MVSVSSVSRLLGAALALLPSLALAQSAADYYVHSLPGAPAEPPIKMHAGHIEITPETNGNLFFWHFQNQHIANKQRTLVWLNGGPGCSSEDGALMEVGPYRMKDNTTLVYNNGSWSEFANLLFVDNPVGTGYSYVNTNSYVTELDQMAGQFVIFLEKYFALFPEYEHDDLYFAGESYAGQHIPYIAKAILDRNKKPETKTKWNLEGLLIGNGWISPREQYEAYLSFAYKKGLIKEGTNEAAQLQQQWRICESRMATDPGRVDYHDCEKVLSQMLAFTSKIGDSGKRMCYNMYDVRLRDTHPDCGMNWPPDLKHVEPYLQSRAVTEALHINKNKVTGWQECTSNVGSAMRNLKSRAAVSLLPEILQEVPVLLFSGAEDYICNHLGTEAFLGNLEWNGGKGFELTPGTWAPRRDWTVEGQAAGFWQEARNLTYVLFNDASHMVPFDHPRRSRDMLDRFMKVDISSVGGLPVDSRIDGEKGPQTSVTGGDPEKSTSDQEHEKEVEDARWHAYRRSGEIVLAIAVAAFCAWAYFVWRDRKKRRGYRGLAEPSAESISLNGGAFRRRDRERDVEAAEVSELEDLTVETPVEEKRYSIGVDSDDEQESGVVRGGDAVASSSK
ncbi:probable Pheromone-processing carboxypeptidase KEX1 [Cephalotrichum gorgonifer]|uniref:Pheromone-processing carboxypeptidase KEX1 n=1 Tax=Cephalotrichum gorgonifer TaxID=2041049 RepID=A0AAE8SZ74_9PEZI|nr:probable Pheromone-processing carboxypeptidase KEX1 [Cephalotrichum gorgonifer]